MAEPDDITDPPLPPELQRSLHDMVLGCYAAIGRLTDGMTARLGQLSPLEAGALEHLCQALDALAQRGTEAPNSLNLRAMSPQGFAVQLTLRRPDSNQLFHALTACQEWLLAQGYKPC